MRLKQPSGAGGKMSRFLSYVLRHAPESIGLELEPGGWVDVHVLLRKLAAHGNALTRDDLDKIVREDKKQRYALEGGRIRANQGHSVEVDLGYEPATPPAELYHGTRREHLSSIWREGLRKMERHHVHLAETREQAVSSSRPVSLKIVASAMQHYGHVFYRSTNGVWLTDHVPPDFLSY